jgi:hypothetical protein
VADLTIPNEEIMSIYVRDIVENWFTSPEKTQELENLAEQLVSGDIEKFKKLFIEFCMDAFSYHDVGGDEPERFYHGFVLGMLVCLRDRYRIVSNRESGTGRADLIMTPLSVVSHQSSVVSPQSTVHSQQSTVNSQQSTPRGIIFEFKTVDKAKRQTFESVIERAKKQIIEKNYAQELKAQGVTEIVHIIAVFEGKEVRLESF